MVVVAIIIIIETCGGAGGYNRTIRSIRLSVWSIYSSSVSSSDHNTEQHKLSYTTDSGRGNYSTLVEAQRWLIDSASSKARFDAAVSFIDDTVQLHRSSVREQNISAPVKVGRF